MSASSFDLKLLRLFRTVGHTPQTERAVARFSRLGEHAAIWLALGTAGAAVDSARRKQWQRATKTIAGAYLLNIGLKFVVRRRRPELPDLPPLSSTVTSLSFPSAHSTSSFAAARSLSSILPTGPLYAAATAMALSRIFLGLHYPTDVVAGAILGTLVGRTGR